MRLGAGHSANRPCHTVGRQHTASWRPCTGVQPVQEDRRGYDRRSASRHRCQCQSERQEGTDWRQRAAAAAAAMLLTIPSLGAPPPAFGAAPWWTTLQQRLKAEAEQQQPQQQAALQRAAEQQTPPALADAASLPPLPTDFPPLPPLELPKYKQLTLKNGLRVFLLEDHELPVVRGTLLMRGGQRASPEDKVGLASLSAAIQRSGGSLQHPGASLEDELESRAASIEGGASAEAIGFGWQCLTEDTPDVLRLFAEVLLYPALPQDKLDLAKSQVLNALEHRNDNPSAIPGRELSKLIYGKGSVFAREPTPESVSGISVQDMRAFLATWERPDAAVMGVVGDFDPKQMQQLVEGVLGSWAPPPGQPQPPPLPNPPLPDQAPIAGKIFLVDQPGATQTSIAVGEPGIQMMDPDEYPLDILDSLFNGFGGKLFNQLRSRQGLAYSVSGGWPSTPIDHPGLFVAGAETARPAALLAALRGALQEATEAAPSEEDVQRAREEALNQFVFSFASRPAQLNRLVTFDLLGVPQDYLFRYRDGIERVTPADVLAAAQRRLHPDRQTVVVAGDAARLRPELEALGLPVEDLTLE